MFISEEFFEDISMAEQRFIIGHELTHIKEHHARYLNLVLYTLALMLLITAYFFNKYIYLLIKKYMHQKYHTYCNIIASIILFSSCVLVPDLIGLAYRRHIEWVADHKSLCILTPMRDA